MRIYRMLTAMMLGVLAPVALPQDLLRPALAKALTAQCTQEPGYQSCVTALRYHGLGKDDDALQALFNFALDEVVKQHYKVAKDSLKEEFWKLVATAGAPDQPSCPSALPMVLSYHFGLSPQVLADAVDDYAKNPFLALSDLLAVPDRLFAAPGGVNNWIQMYGQVYRLCFKTDSFLFLKINVALGRKPSK